METVHALCSCVVLQLIMLKLYSGPHLSHKCFFYLTTKYWLHPQLIVFSALAAGSCG